jgi:hypothetical protein
MVLEIAPFRFRAGCITFPEWVTLLTLCLAPLIAHIISGTIPVSYLAHNRPTWLDSLCHYNPTSILWRYAVIVDRRLRATGWNRNDLAATNAIFWTTNGWNGDESMVASSTPHRVLAPEKSHVKIFSVTMFKTIIITIQGVSAAYAIVGALTGTVVFSPMQGMGMDVIFFPLAILGLLRLFAAAWLTEDFVYVYSEAALHQPSTHNGAVNEVGLPLMDNKNEPDPWLITPLTIGSDFHPPNTSWRSRAFRTFYFLICGGIWALSFFSVVPLPGQSAYYTVTSFMTGCFYLAFLTISTCLYAFYFARGKTTTTIIPCISSWWYKIYTILLMTMILVMIVVSSLETARGPDGVYGSMELVLEMDCKSKSNWWPVLPQYAFSGLVSSRYNNVTNAERTIMGLPTTDVLDNSTVADAQYWLYSFAGYCFGKFNEN